MPELSHYNAHTLCDCGQPPRNRRGYNVWKLMRSEGWMGRTARWMESSVVCRAFEFFFSKGIFYPRPEAFVSERLSHFSPQRLSEMTEIWEQFLMLTRSREAALRTISHCVNCEPRRHVSPTVKPGELFSLEKQGEGGVEERKKRHRSNGHHEVYRISIQLESEKLLNPSWEYSEERSWPEAKIILILLCLINI